MLSIKLLVLTFMFMFLVDTSVGRLDSVQLRILYNSEVTAAEYWTRPLDSGWFFRRRKRDWNYRYIHTGIVVTTTYNGGSKWLIHKGGSFGTHEDSSSTVIVDARYIGNGWTRERCGIVYGQNSVLQFMVAGGVYIRYNIVTYNCQTASNNIWNTLVFYDINCYNNY